MGSFDYVEFISFYEKKETEPKRLFGIPAIAEYRTSCT